MDSSFCRLNTRSVPLFSTAGSETVKFFGTLPSFPVLLTIAKSAPLNLSSLISVHERERVPVTFPANSTEVSVAATNCPVKRSPLTNKILSRAVPLEFVVASPVWKNAKKDTSNKQVEARQGPYDNSPLRSLLRNGAPPKMACRAWRRSTAGRRKQFVPGILDPDRKGQ